MKKVFGHGDLVRVKLPKKRAFVGTYYSEYKRHKNSQRSICVNTPSGAGIAFPIRYVTRCKKQPRSLARLFQ